MNPEGVRIVRCNPNTKNSFCWHVSHPRNEIIRRFASWNSLTRSHCDALDDMQGCRWDVGTLDLGQEGRYLPVTY